MKKLLTEAGQAKGMHEHAKGYSHDTSFKGMGSRLVHGHHETCPSPRALESVLCRMQSRSMVYVSSVYCLYGGSGSGSMHRVQEPAKWIEPRGGWEACGRERKYGLR